MSKLRKRLLSAFTTLVVAAGIVAVQATPAHAAWECNVGYFCIFDTENGQGGSYYWGPNYAAGCYNIGGYWNDRAGSARNRMTSSQGDPVTLYMHANCVVGSHPTINVYRHTSVSFVPAQTYGEVYSSFYIYP